MFKLKESSSLLRERGALLHGALDAVIPQRQWSRAEFDAHQLRQLKALFGHAFQNVPLYRRKYTAAGFAPGDLQSLADLERIPILTKAELRAASASELAGDHEGRCHRWIQSSGSTGVPAGIWRSEESLWHFMAQNTLLYYDWCNGTPLTKAAYFLDLSPDSIDYALADLLRTVIAEECIIAVTDPVETHLERLLELQPEFISSYPSAMRSLALLMRERGIRDERLKLLHLTSEMLNQRTRELLLDRFPNARLIETYTSTEAGLIAWECAGHQRWHLDESHLIGEICQEPGAPPADGGRLVVTDLNNWATPIIRYSGLGDLCEWELSACPCGSPLRSLRQIRGRVADTLVRSDGRGVSPYRVTNALDEVVGICQYQVVQHATRDFEVLVVADFAAAQPQERVVAGVRSALRDAMAEEVRCEVRWVARIAPKINRHKVPLVICHVPEARS